MTPQQLVDRVNKEADARFGETIERLLFMLSNRHTHQSWRKECTCDYCVFISGEYTNAKLRLHRLKKRIYYYDNFWNLTDTEMRVMLDLEMLRFKQMVLVSELKDHKKKLRQDII